MKRKKDIFYEKKKIEIFKLSYLLCLIGVIIACWGMGLLMISNFNMGYPLTALLGIAILAMGVFYNWLPKWFLRTCFAGIAVLLLSMSALFLYGQVDTATGNEDAVIVLGAGLRGEQVSFSLRRRLDTAMEYAEENPRAIIVVSGGQGPDEAIPEAEAMYRYLVAAGIDEERIVKEDQSTSTAENMAFSKEILDEMLGEEYSIVYVTNDFHAFRAGLTAKDAGFDASRKSAGLDWFLYPVTYVRETAACAAVLVTRLIF